MVKYFLNVYLNILLSYIVIKVIFFILNILNQKNFLTDSRQPNAHKKENQQKGAKMLLPWILITWIVLVFNLGVGILFGLDIQYPFKVDILIYLTAYGDQIYYTMAYVLQLETLKSFLGSAR